MSYEKDLVETIEAFESDRGILAADESNGTIGKRFETIGLENTPENRQRYRQLLAETSGLEDYIAGVILFEETFTQTDKNGTSLAARFAEKGILPGIKVDQGLTNLPNTDEETITQGLDGLENRLRHFKELGARFAKWRAVFTISDTTPSLTAIHAGCEALARYAATCQSVGIVPIVEPEILMDGPHSIEIAAVSAEIVMHELFRALFVHQVELNYMLLKPSMVTPGSESAEDASPEDVADYTLDVLRRHVPAAVPGIYFLSGGQTPIRATENLSAINGFAPQPWRLNFSYGRALQEDCLKAWQGKDDHIQAAQEALLKRARLNHLACLGEYAPQMEEEALPA